MRAICAGTANKRDVVHSSLEQYREVYLKTVQGMDVIKTVRGSNLPHVPKLTLVFLRLCATMFWAKTADEQFAYWYRTAGHFDHWYDVESALPINADHPLRALHATKQ